MSKRKAGLAAKVRKYLQAKEVGKRGYERADRLLAEIAGEAEAGDEISISASGRKAVLVDKFAEKQIVWTPCAARRWELKVIEP